ncbi:fimbrial protein [Pseudomonas sp. NPDC087346]|uniref:fimbrial protein n=1 Tax=Pseudomonas sp. NPDC087346 TaxID=3364438 RepID=UPI00381F11D5
MAVTASNNPTIAFTCNSGSDPQGIKSATGEPAVNQIIPFGKTGLGFSINSGGGPDAIYPTYRTPGTGTTTSNPYRLRIYKIGPIANTVTISAGTFVNYMAGSLYVYTGVLSGPVVVTPGSCELATSDVPMGEHAASEFSRIGYTSKPIDFTVRLNNCSGTINKVQYTMTPGQGWRDPANAVIKLDPGSVTGLGIQLLKDGRLVPVGGAGELPKPTGSDASYTFTAAYYQVENVVRAGDANASLTVQISYL